MWLRTATARFSSFNVLDGKIDINISVLKKRTEAVANAMKVLSSLVEKGGGKKAVELHTLVRKKLMARQRIKLLLDDDSPFLELGTFAGLSMDYGNIAAAGSVTGVGRIHGRYCIIGANDATVKGGVFFPVSVMKQIRVQNISRVNCLPSIYVVDSGGAFLPLQAEIFPDEEHGGRTFYNEAVFSARGIPQIAVVCGSSTAGGAYCPTMTEEAVIVNKSGIIFLGGPPLVKAATGEIVTDQELGGADLHCRVSGCTDYFANSEEEAFQMCRDSILSLNLPVTVANAKVQEPLYSSGDLDVLAVKESIEKHDVYMILARILDGSMFKEFKKEFGKNLICGFSLLRGNIVGVLANCGFVSCQDAQKGAHFIELCTKREIPLVFLQNSGNENQRMPFPSQENVIKDRAKMIMAHCTTNVPKIVINIGGCFEDDNFLMCGIPFGCNFMFSWPLAQASLEGQKKLSQVKNDLIENCNDVDSCLKLFENTSSAFFRASRVLVDNIILPSQTRRVLALCLDIATTKTSHATLSREKSSALFRM